MKHVGLITGAGGALGAALAQKLAGFHTHLVLHDIDLPSLEPVYDLIEAHTACEASLVPINFKTAGASEFMQLEEALRETYGQVNTLILNAASLPAFTPVRHFDPVQWYEVLQVNLNAHFHVLQSVLPLMPDGGQIMLISDEALNTAPAYYGAYAVAKAGLEQLIRLVEVEHDALTCHIERLPPFQSPMRQRLFPGADNSHLPTALDIAEELAARLRQYMRHHSIPDQPEEKHHQHGHEPILLAARSPEEDDMS